MKYKTLSEAIQDDFGLSEDELGTLDEVGSWRGLFHIVDWNIDIYLLESSMESSLRAKLSIIEKIKKGLECNLEELIGLYQEFCKKQKLNGDVAFALDFYGKYSNEAYDLLHKMYPGMFIKRSKNRLITDPFEPSMQ